jgi:hypothetical protein
MPVLNNYAKKVIFFTIILFLCNFCKSQPIQFFVRDLSRLKDFIIKDLNFHKKKASRLREAFYFDF